MNCFNKYFLFIFFLLFFTFIPKAMAQTPPANFLQTETAASLGLAHMVDVVDKDVKDGSLLTTTTEGVTLTKIPYDPQIIGVVARDAAIIISTKEGKNNMPVISTGRVYVLVSSQNGNIKKGDIITSSNIPGVGVKALKSGYVLGFAQEDYTETDPKKQGKIVVDLSLHYFNSRSALAGTLTDIFKIALLPTRDAPTPLFKYIVAALVVLASFLLGFFSFGRTAAKGVEALGRNPAASFTIHLGIIINVIIVITIIFAGLVVAFLILRL